MTPMKSHCFDCPWKEAGNREDMIDLMDTETVWPCHNTATFSEGEYGEIIDLIEEDRNRECFGYLMFQKESRIQ